MFNQNPDSTFNFKKNQDSIKKFRITIKKRKSQIWYQETLSANKKQHDGIAKHKHLNNSKSEP